MTRGHPAWKALGIEPTSDQRAIRSAYIAKLKAIDPDVDPQAFIELREAFTFVSAGTANAARDSEREDPATLTENGDAEELARDSHAEALARLLLGGSAEHDGKHWYERQATPNQALALREHWQAIVSDPRMEKVTFYADVERWLSELIVRTAPLSDPLVVRATLYFGWHRSKADVAQTPAIVALVGHHRLLDFINALKSRHHPLHRAWLDLSTPFVSDAGRGSIDIRHVHELLTTAESYPGLTSYFIPEHVAFWMNAPVPGSRNNIGWWLPLSLLALGLFGLVLVAGANGGGTQ